MTDMGHIRAGIYYTCKLPTQFYWW